MNKEQCRIEFEKWVKDSKINLSLCARVGKEGEYAFAAQKAWEAWQYLWNARAPYNRAGRHNSPLREKLIKAIGLNLGWEESAAELVDDVIMPTIKEFLTVKPNESE